MTIAEHLVEIMMPAVMIMLMMKRMMMMMMLRMMTMMTIVMDDSELQCSWLGGNYK